MATIFDIIKRITVTKDKWNDIPEEEKNTFNSFSRNIFRNVTIYFTAHTMKGFLAKGP